MAYQRGDVVPLPFPFTDLSAVRTRPAVVVSVEGFVQDTSDTTFPMFVSTQWGFGNQSRRVSLLAFKFCACVTLACNGSVYHLTSEVFESSWNVDL